METPMLDYVVSQLDAAKGAWPTVAAGSGVPVRTIEKIARQETIDPRISSVQRLYDFFRSK